MRRLFLEPTLLTNDTVLIDGADAHHLLHVLRVRPGDPLVLMDNEGHAFHAEVIATDRRTVTALRQEAADVPLEPAVAITVAQAIGKGDKFEQVVQHGTEVGATAFLPLQTERGVVKLNAREMDSKLARWSLIAKGAAEQAGRLCIPPVSRITTLPELAGQFADYALVLLLHPQGCLLREALDTALSPPRSLPLASPTLVLVGPEGGFSPKEIAQATEAGAQIVSLGPYVLRTETAALVAVSQLRYALEAARP